MPALRSLAFVSSLVFMAGSVGCGTTRSTDTSRTATEQLLVSDAIDRTVQQLNFRRLAGHTVFLDDSYLSNAVDKAYLVSTLRQHLLASGCILASTRDEATFILEARAGSVGTNKSEVLFGVPQMNLPMTIPGVPSTIPEIPVVKKTNHRGVVKLAVFAYHRETGTAVWQSGLVRDESTGKDTWVLGAGPFQWGTIHEGANFAGSKLRNPLDVDERRAFQRPPVVGIGQEYPFQQRPERIHRLPLPTQAPAERTAGAEAPGEATK